MANKLPSRSQMTNIQADYIRMAKGSLYFFARSVMGFSDLTEELHGPIAAYLQAFPWNGAPEITRSKWLIVPRDCFKSTLASVALPLWILCHDPQATIVLLSASEDNTKKWLDAIKRVITSRPMFRWLFPEIVPESEARWNANEIVIARDDSLMPVPQASITASSIMGGQASQHYKYIILDDPINEKIAQQPSSIPAIVDRYKLTEALKSGPDSCFIGVGTPWGAGDVIEYARENEVANSRMCMWKIGAYGKFELEPKVVLEAYDETILWRGTDGNPIFPKRLSRETLEFYEQHKLGPLLFAAQYLVDPYHASNSGFDLSLAGYFSLDKDLRLTCSCHPNHRHRLNQMNVVGSVDPAVSDREDACRTAITVGAVGACECRFLLDVKAGRWLPDEAARQIANTANQWIDVISAMGIEEEAQQKVFRYYLTDTGLFPGTVPLIPVKASGRSKDVRVNGHQPAWANKQWHIRPGQGEFLNELSKFPRCKHRDILDAWAYLNDLFYVPTQGEDIVHGSAISFLNSQREQADLSKLEEAGGRWY